MKRAGSGSLPVQPVAAGPSAKPVCFRPEVSAPAGLRMQPARLNGGGPKGRSAGLGQADLGVWHLRPHQGAWFVHLLMLDVCRICGQKYAVRASGIPLAPGIRGWAEDAIEAAGQETPTAHPRSAPRKSVRGPPRRPWKGRMWRHRLWMAPVRTRERSPGQPAAVARAMKDCCSSRAEDGSKRTVPSAPGPSPGTAAIWRAPRSPGRSCS